MSSPVRDILHVAFFELADSLRSRRVVVLFILYFAGAMASTYGYINFLQNIEEVVADTLLISKSSETGGLTEVVMESKAYRDALYHMNDKDRVLVDHLLKIPPVALFYGWIIFVFTPFLIMLTSSSRIADEVSSGSIRFILFRTSRLNWVIGKFVGQFLQVCIALLLSAAGAWLMAHFRLPRMDGGSTAVYMLIFALKACVVSLAYLGLALMVSQLFRSPHIATASGFIILIALIVLSVVADYRADHHDSAAWRTVLHLMPTYYGEELKRPELSRVITGGVYLFVLSFCYLFAGYAVFRRRDA